MYGYSSSWKRAEASSLISAASGTMDEALVTLAVRTGMRQGELAALRWDDLDLSHRPTITVRRSADTHTIGPGLCRIPDMDFGEPSEGEVPLIGLLGR